MDLRIQENCENIDWNQVREYLKLVGMGYHGIHKRLPQQNAPKEVWRQYIKKSYPGNAA